VSGCARSERNADEQETEQQQGAQPHQSEKLKSRTTRPVFLLLVALLAHALVALPCAHAQTYPSRPIKLIVPWSAGGTADTRGRQVAEVLAKELGQPVVVENRPGAGATVGAALVAQAKPDGYTLLWGSVNELAIRPAAAALAYDPAHDFAPVALVNVNALLLVVHPSVGVKSVKELVQLAKARPGQVAYASAGAGTVHHFAGALLSRRAGIVMTHVPYKGEAPAVADVTAGHVQVGLCLPAPCLELVRAGRLNALMVFANRREPALPGVPTAREAGFEGLELVSWGGLLAPAATPGDVVMRLHGALSKAMAGTDLKARIERTGAQAMVTSPEAFGSFLQMERSKWTDILRTTGIELEE
jgi:tripartite-type tricarboxylate transporter receptor subunit TctC